MTALQNHAGHRNDLPLTLLSSESWMFFNAVDRHLGGAPKDGENRTIGEGIDRIVAPIAGSDKLAVNAQYAREFRSRKSDRIARAARFRAGAGMTHYMEVSPVFGKTASKKNRGFFAS